MPPKKISDNSRENSMVSMKKKDQDVFDEIEKYDGEFKDSGKINTKKLSMNSEDVLYIEKNIKGNIKLKKDEYKNLHDKKEKLEQKERKDRPDVGVFDFVFISLCGCCMRSNYKYLLITQCLKVAEDYLQAESLIKSQFELNMFKKLMLTDGQQMLFRFIFKHLEFENGIKGLRYLEEISEREVPFKLEEIKKMSSENSPIDRKLIKEFEDFIESK